MTRYAIQDSEGRYLTVLAMQPAWTDNVDMAYCYDDRETAEHFAAIRGGVVVEL